MTIWQYMAEGGNIMYVLLVFNVIGLATMAYMFMNLLAQMKKVDVIGEAIAVTINPLPNRDRSTKIELARQELNIHMSKAEKGLGTIRLIATISPLLGLLGTVIGVYMAFKVIASQGLTDPNAFASGLSLALITTIGGLIVAIPHYIGQNYLIGLLDRLEVQIEKSLSYKIQ